MGFFYIEKADKRIKNRPKWKLTRTPKRTEALANAMSRAVKVDLVKGISKFRTKIPDKEVIYQAWLKGSYSGIVSTIPWDDLHKDLGPAKDRLREGLGASMSSALVAIPPSKRPELRYDYKNPRIERVFNKRAGEWITAIDADTRKNIQTIVHNQFTQGLSPRDLAASIKNTVGLYPRLSNAHVNYVKGLKASGMPEAKVEKLGDAYYDKLLTYRSTMIARTESQFMLNRGQLEVWRESSDQGLIPREAKKVWVVDGDPCEICEPMDGIAVGLAESWLLNTGDVVEIPTESHPHCYCIMTIEYGDGTEGEEE